MANRIDLAAQSLEELFHLEKTTGGHRIDSLYLQFYRQLRDAILEGRIRENAKLWSPRNVSKVLGISRNTVISAYSRLHDDRLIERKARRGYFVIDTSFSKLSARGRRSAKIAENIKVPTDPIPFSTSLPNVIDRETYKRWTRIVTRYWKKTFTPPTSEEDKKKIRRILGYSDPQGYELLRKALEEYLNEYRGVHCSLDQIIITTGSQQCFDLIARLTLDPGDWVWYEQPGYHGARYCIQAAGAKLQPVPVDDEGLEVDTAIKNGCKPKLIYTTPSSHFPTGAIMPLRRRVELLEYAHTNKALIIEDDHNPYLYLGDLSDSIQKLEQTRLGTERTFYVGSLTKTLFPGLRLGYMIVPKDLRKEFVTFKASMDIHHTIIGQASLAHFIRNDFHIHIERMRNGYRKRQATLVENISDKLSDYIEFKNLRTIKEKNDQYKIAVESGLELTTYATEFALDRGFDDKKFSEYAISEERGDKKVQVRPLSSFYIDNTAAKQGLVFGFAGFDDSELIEGVNCLKEHFEAYFSRHTEN